MIPVGFSTKANPAAAVAQIDTLLAGVNPDSNTVTYTLPRATTEQIIDIIGQSLTMDEDSEFDFNAMKAAMGYIAANNPNAAEADQVACLVRRGRQDNKRRNDNRLQNAPEGTADHTAMQPIRGSRPALYLFREEGHAANGWSDCRFYWPVLMPPPGMQPVIFSSKTGN